jgi:hypothetical protein
VRIGQRRGGTLKEGGDMGKEETERERHSGRKGTRPEIGRKRTERERKRTPRGEGEQARKRQGGTLG